MQKSALGLAFILMSTGSGSALDAAQDEVRRLERSWHRCLREAYAHQSAGQSRAGDQRNALDECQEREDAYVAATLAAQAADGAAGDRSLPSRARGWAASVAAYVLDPITDWVGSLKR